MADNSSFKTMESKEAMEPTISQVSEALRVIEDIKETSSKILVNKRQFHCLADRVNTIGEQLSNMGLVVDNTSAGKVDHPAYDMLLSVLQKRKAEVSKYVTAEASIIRPEDREAFKEVHMALDAMRAQFPDENFKFSTSKSERDANMLTEDAAAQDLATTPAVEVAEMAGSLHIKESKTNETSGQEAPKEMTEEEKQFEEKLRLVLSVGENNKCIPEENDFAELRNLLKKKAHPVCYDGFEPSGRMHIAQGLMKVLNVNKLTKSGCYFKIWIADWFALLNNKMGGDLEKIQNAGRLMIEVWKAAGMDLSRVEFLWSSEEIIGRAEEYLLLLMDIHMHSTLNRVTRCCPIMGRKEGDEMPAAQILYPCMQCADIFFLKADICQLGNDQVRVNVLAREYCDRIKRKPKPIILSHHMLPGLLAGQEKMSKSDPNSAIFMDDDEAEVKKKIKQAFCPPQQVAGNPCIEYVQYIVLPWFGQFEVQRDDKNGGNKIYTDIGELKKDFTEGALHPADLKPALWTGLNIILQPVRDHFQNDPTAKDLLKTVKSYKVTK